MVTHHTDTSTAHAAADPHKTLVRLIKDIRVAFLITASAESSGGVRGRPMYTQKVDEETFDGELFFMSDIDAAKVAEIAANRQVVLTFADNHHNRYVTIVGTATAEHDPAKARELWNIGAKSWWPEGPESPRLAIIRVRVQEAEYWDGPGSITYALKFVKALATHQRMGSEETHHQKLTM